MFAVCVHAILQILKYSPQEARSVLFQYQPSFFLLHDDTLTMVRHLIEEQPVRRRQGDDGHDEAREDKWHENMSFNLALRKPTRNILLDFLASEELRVVMDIENTVSGASSASS